jgi:hypothetical protein
MFVEACVLFTVRMLESVSILESTSINYLLSEILKTIIINYKKMGSVQLKMSYLNLLNYLLYDLFWLKL